MDWTRLMEINEGYQVSRILQAAVDYDIFDTTEGTGAAAQQVASEKGLHDGAVELLLNALASLGFLQKEGAVFSNTEATSRYLVTSSPLYFGHFIRFSSQGWDVWERLQQSLRTGTPARSPDYYQSNEAETELYIMAMHDISTARGDIFALPQRIDLSQCRNLLDVGGGPGTFTIGFCKAYPKLQGTIFDLPGTLKIAQRLLKKHEMSHRIGLIPGDFKRDELPGGFDAVFLSNIIHSEDIPTNEQLMAKIYGALNPGGMLIIKDHIMDEARIQPNIGAIFAVEMLLFTQGRTYSFQEVKGWLRGVGFSQIREAPPQPPLTSSLIFAQKRKR